MPASIAAGVVFFIYLGVAALLKREWRRPRPGAAALDWHRHRLGLVGASLILVGVVLQTAPLSEWQRHARNWLPGLYLLVGYWLPAQLPARPSPGLAAWLQDADRRLFQAGLASWVARAPRLLLGYLEATYLCCYAVVPAGLAWLYVSGHSGEANRFWTSVLVAALPCYALLPWLETRPPRSVEPESALDTRGLVLRRANLRLLDAASVGANTFPSGHAAASLAAALAVGAVSPVAGAVFGILAISIATASVVGRYHYALDAVFGMLLGLAGFVVSRLV